MFDIHNEMKREGYEIIDGKVFLGGIQVFSRFAKKTFG